MPHRRFITYAMLPRGDFGVPPPPPPQDQAPSQGEEEEDSDEEEFLA
jgi:hypothetical protein